MRRRPLRWMKRTARAVTTSAVALLATKLTILLVAAIVAFVISWFVWGSASALAEALLIAWVLALIVDPFVKNRLAREVARETFWVLLNDRAPQGFRQYVEQLIRSTVFYRSVEWVFKFTWVDGDQEVVKVDIQLSIEGVCFDRDGYTPALRAYVLASSDGYQTEYHQFKVVGRGASGQSLEVDVHMESDPPIEQFVSTAPDGSIRLDEAAIIDAVGEGKTIGYEETFTVQRGVTIFRKSRGFFPMMGSKGVIRQTFTVRRGGAASELGFALLAAGSGETVELVPGQRRTLTEAESVSPFMILSWAPRVG